MFLKISFKSENFGLSVFFDSSFFTFLNPSADKNVNANPPITNIITIGSFQLTPLPSNMAEKIAATSAKLFISIFVPFAANTKPTTNEDENQPMEAQTRIFPKSTPFSLAFKTAKESEIAPIGQLKSPKIK